MSILRDLEPQHATIHQSASSGTATKLAWILAALLLLGGAAWLAFYMQKNVATSDTAAPFPPNSQENTAARTPRTEVATSTQSPARNEPAAPTGAGVAVIREDVAAQASAKAAKSDPPNVFQTMQMELDKSRNDKVATNTTPAPQAKTPAMTEEAPKTQASKPASEGNKQAKAAATPSGNTASRQTKSDKRFAERDIEIITAIVK